MSCVFLAVLLALGLAPHWPPSWWWLANLFQPLPQWPLVFPLGLMLFWAAGSRDRAALVLNGLAAVVLISGIMGFQIPLGLRDGRDAALSLRVLTVNLGDGARLKDLARLAENVRPDVMALQEVHADDEVLLRRLFPPSAWQVEVRNHLGLVSRFPVTDMHVLDRRMFGGWGYFIGGGRLRTPVGQVSFFNVHLETPRKGLEALRAEGIPGMRRVTELQEAESLQAAQWASAGEHVIVAGDFNMTTANPIFQKYWAPWRDAFASAGKGFGYTKYTRWHGVRIDHVLHDADWTARYAAVQDTIGGDHRPLVVDVAFVGTPQPPAPIPDFRAAEGLRAKALIYEDFETGSGRFAEGQEAEVGVDPEAGSPRGTALHARFKSGQDHLALRPAMREWVLERYPSLVFFYRIPSGTPLVVRGRTGFGDWICLGGTASGVCPGTMVKTPGSLIDDGAWHQARWDARAQVQSLLPALTALTEVEFQIPVNRRMGDEFWLDDVRILPQDAVLFEPSENE